MHFGHLALKVGATRQIRYCPECWWVDKWEFLFWNSIFCVCPSSEFRITFGLSSLQKPAPHRVVWIPQLPADCRLARAVTTMLRTALVTAPFPSLPLSIWGSVLHAGSYSWPQAWRSCLRNGQSINRLKFSFVWTQFFLSFEHKILKMVFSAKSLGFFPLANPL